GEDRFFLSGFFILLVHAIDVLAQTKRPVQWHIYLSRLVPEVVGYLYGFVMLFHFHAARRKHLRRLLQCTGIFVFLLLPEETLFTICKSLYNTAHIAKHLHLR